MYCAYRSSALAGAKNSDTRQLWALLRQTGNWGVKKQNVQNIELNQINDYFVNIASDPCYSCENVIKIALQAPHRPANCNNYTSDHVQIMLSRISRTSPGNDNIPYWVYRDCSSELAEV